MKKRLLAISILTLIGLYNFVNGQVPTWQWANSGVGTNDDMVNSVTTDAFGNSIVVGFFQSPTITFDSTTLTNAGSTNMFIVKYDPTGTVIWAKSAGGSGFDIANSVTVDAFGNSVVVGTFKSPTIAFDTTNLINVGAPFYSDLFIVKYDPLGSVIWAQSVGDINDDVATSVTEDVAGNFIVVGYFNSPSITFGNTTLAVAHPNNTDVFVVNYNQLGNVLWAKSAGGNSNDWATSVTTDAVGNLTLAGYFNSPVIIFDSTSLTNSSGSNDIFIIKYDSTGTVLWANSTGGSFDDIPTAITADAFGNIIVAGWYISPTITFNTTTLTNVDSTGSRDIFIVKYDISGNVIWAKSAGGIGDFEAATSITSNAFGDFTVAGFFNSSIITFDSFSLTNSGAYDMFIVKYNSGGTASWAIAIGGISYDNANSITADAFGNLMVAGSFSSSTIAFGSTILSNAGNSDMFIAKLNNTTTIENSESKPQITVYPNPSNGNFTMQTSDDIPYSIKIYNSLGERIYEEEKIDTTKKVINIAEQPNGIYFLQIQTKNGATSKKILIVR